MNLVRNIRNFHFTYYKISKLNLGPSNWWKFSQNCVGLNQSPINLEYEQAIVRRSSTIRLSYFTKSVQSVVVSSDIEAF